MVLLRLLCVLCCFLLFFAFFAAFVAKTFFFKPAMLTQITNNAAENIGKVIDIFYIPSRNLLEVFNSLTIFDCDHRLFHGWLEITTVDKLKSINFRKTKKQKLELAKKKGLWTHHKTGYKTKMLLKSTDNPISIILKIRDFQLVWR